MQIEVKDGGEMPKRLVAVYGSKSQKTVHVGEPGGCTLLTVRGGTYGDNFDVLAEMVAAYNAAREEGGAL